MPVANYLNFSDASFDLQMGRDIDRTLTANIEQRIVSSGQGGLLTWNVRREGSGNVSDQVIVNGKDATSYTVTVGDWHAVQETIRSSNIHPGDNTVEFRVTSGSATLSIADVVLFYRHPA